MEILTEHPVEMSFSTNELIIMNVFINKFGLLIRLPQDKTRPPTARNFFFSSLLLPSLELSDTKVYEP